MIIVKKNEKSKQKKDQNVPIRGNDWERTFTIEERRVSEYVDLYESIGYETRVEPATPDEIEECQACFKAEFDNLRTIFIRLKENKKNEMNLEELL